MLSTKNIGKMISIHALVKRATDLCYSFVILRDISIHALVKRATRHNKTGAHDKRYFNPRPREEGDHGERELLC